MGKIRKTYLLFHFKGTGINHISTEIISSWYLFIYLSMGNVFTDPGKLLAPEQSFIKTGRAISHNYTRIYIQGLHDIQSKQISAPTSPLPPPTLTPLKSPAYLSSLLLLFQDIFCFCSSCSNTPVPFGDRELGSKQVIRV